MIEILDNIGCRVHIGTATIPSALEKAILKILGKNDVQYVKLNNKTLDTFDRHIIHKTDSFDKLYNIINQAIVSKQKILIVANKVARAQELYQLISDLYPSTPKMLIHSRYKRLDRNKLECDLKEIYNTGVDPCIVVSTQVIEVSLDINFDLMITETAPIDSLIQRFGRINRKRDYSTIGKYKNVYVVSPPINEKDCKPYSIDILKRSFDILPNEEILKESSLQDLIDQVYPSVEVMNIDLDSVFKNGRWCLRELWHLPKSALIERLDIDSIACITEQDKDTYLKADPERRISMEIPVNYNSIRWKKLEQLSVGSNPFVVPDSSYTAEKGLDLNEVSVENYNPNYQII